MIVQSLFIRLFQFHKGTIRTFGSGLLFQSVFDFNSIKVQLEPRFDSASNLNAKPFQFHKGTIRTKFLLQQIVAYQISIP